MEKTEILAYVVAIVLVLLFGVGGTYYFGQRGGFNEPITSTTMAAYFTIATMSTVGYGDIYPITDTARLFVMVLIIIGIAVVFSAIVAIGGDFMQSRIETLTGRVTTFEKRSLNKHVILVGSNNTNQYLAEKLSEKNERFIIVTNDTGNAEHFREMGWKAYVADSTSEEDMREFEPKRAKAIVIDIKDNSRAIYALLVAKELVTTAKIVVIAPSKAAEHHLRSIAAGKALVVNPADIAANTISESIFK